jgi:hypothetical protein
MATPLTAAQLLAALKAEGCTVVEEPGWRTRNRNSKGPWNDLRGSIVHHTVTGGTASTVAILRDGYAALPGPLCHGGIMKDGRVHLIGYGRANHAGGGDPRVLQAVTNEDYGDRPPAPTVGNADGTDGNRHFYGWECENWGDGKDPWPAVQMEAIVRVQAALIRAHRAKGDAWGLEAKSVIGHLEWSDDKSDPRGFTMKSLRARVAERLEHLADWSPGDTEEDDMALSSADISKIVDGVVAKLLAGGGALENSDLDRVWTRDVIPAARPPYANADYNTNPTWAPAYALQTAVENIRQTLDIAKRLETKLGAP